MDDRVYKHVELRSREELERDLRSDDPEVVADAILSAGYWDGDWKWIQTQCVWLADSPHMTIRRGVANAIGLIAIFHGKADLHVIIPLLQKLALDPEVAPYAEASLDDVQHFIINLKGEVLGRRLYPDPLQ